MDSLGIVIGQHVTKLRQERGWNQTQLAEKAHLKQGYLSLVEAGLRPNLSVPVALKLAAALGITLDDLVKPTADAA